MMDAVLEVTKEKDYKSLDLHVNSVHSEKYLVSIYGAALGLTRADMLKALFRGTRVDASLIEKEYGPDLLAKEDFDGLVSTLYKFAKHESFETIAIDDGLEYKKYSPSSKEKNEFKSARYSGKTIMKFRFSRKNRVFGYRKCDKFYVLRIENDHRISDFG
jgi:hypothetical protein